MGSGEEQGSRVTANPAATIDIRPPHGLAGIVSTFGNIYEYIQPTASGRPRLAPGFERRYITSIGLPFPLRLSWDKGTEVRSMRCHKLMADTFSSIFQRISDRRLDVRIQSFGGCFNFRSKRRHKELSTHCWGIAIDLNPDTNRPGTVGTMPEGIVAIFKERGFVWGGDWPGPTRDPMHFQFCSGY